MLTMIDQLYDRSYQSARAQMNIDTAKQIRLLFLSVGAAFRALNRIEYAAPWAERRRTGNCG